MVIHEVGLHDFGEATHAGSEHRCSSFTYGWNQQKSRPNTRRVDTIHIPKPIADWVTGAYTMASGAEPHAVVMQLIPPIVVQGKPCPRFRDGIPEDEVAMLQLEAEAAAIDAAEPTEWWVVVAELIFDAGKQ